MANYLTLFRRFFKPALMVAITCIITMFVACGKKLAPENSCFFVQNVYGERISWKGNIPVELYLHSSFPEEMIPGLEAAMARYENSMGHKMFVIKGRIEGPMEPRQDGKSVIYWMDKWEEDKLSEQARTSIFWIGDQLREADMRINNKKYNFYLDQPSNLKDIHLESLIVHELGHVLGLKHNDLQSSVMATYLSSNEERNQMTSADLSSLSCEY